MKKILHISNYYPPHIGGIEQTAHDIATILKNDYDEQVICFNHEKGYKIEEIDGIKIIRVPYFIKISSQAISFKYKKILKKIINDFKPDIIHFHSPNPLVLRALMSTKFNAKLIVHWHADIVKQKVLKVFFIGLHKKMLKKADVVIATSENYIAGSKSLLSVKEKCIALPSAIDFKRLEITEKNKLNAKKIREKYDGKFIGFFVGRHVKYKGIETLIEATKYLNKDVQILIGGVGPLTDDLKRLANGNQNIDFLGLLSDEELKEYMIAMDVFLFPSITKNEAFGLSLAEGLYFGKPAITYTIIGSGVNFVNLNGVTGIEVPNGDSELFAMAIEKLKNDSKLREVLGENAHNRISELLSMEAFKEKLKNIYLELEK